MTEESSKLLSPAERCARLEDSLALLGVELRAGRRVAIEAKEHASKALRLATGKDREIAQAKAAAESLRQSVVDTHGIAASARRAIADHGMHIGRLQKSALADARKLDKIDHALGGHQSFQGVTVADTLRELKEINMAYEEEISEPAVAVKETADPLPIMEALKSLASNVGQGAIQGLSAQFVTEATDMALGKAVEMGVLSAAQAQSKAMRTLVEFALPLVIGLAAQYSWMPQREFFAKSSELALKGQGAVKGAEAMAFVMIFGRELLALPSAQNLKAQLDAAE